MVDIWRRKYIIYTNNIQSIINKKKNCIIFYIRIDHTVSVKKLQIDDDFLINNKNNYYYFLSGRSSVVVVVVKILFWYILILIIN